MRSTLILVFAVPALGCSAPEAKNGAHASGGAGGATAGGSGTHGSAGSVSNGGQGAEGGSVGGSNGATGGSPSAGSAGSAGTAGSAAAGGVGGGSAGRQAGGAGAGGSSGDGGRAGEAGRGGEAGSVGGSAGSGETTLNPTPGNYRQACDGSFGVFVDSEHFLGGNDEDQGLRVYRRGADADPVATVDVSGAIDLASSDEADFEDAARVGNRVYVVSSHGRDKDGNLERERYRFLGVDLSGTVPNVVLTPAGFSTLLLDQMLSATNWTTPNPSVISTLTAAASLGDEEDEDLAPNENGTSIEALAWAPTTSRPNRLLIGFRNPTEGDKAIVVSLLDPDAVLRGATATFGEATLLDLDGLGLRAMSYSPLHEATLLLAGPKDGGGPFRLYRWSGPPSTSPVAVLDITNAPSDASPEAIVVYPNTRDVEILFDQGDHLVSGTVCKDVAVSSRSFSDVIVHVP